MQAAKAKLEASILMPLTSFTTELLAARGEVAQAAHILDPTFNLQKTSLLIKEHEKVLAANAQRRDALVKLRHKAAALGGRLAESHRTYVGNLETAKADELRRSQEEGLVRSLRGKSLEGLRLEDLQATHKNLTEVRCRVLNESLGLAEEKRKVLDELSLVHSRAANETAKQQELRQSMLETHHYCLECHQHVQDVQQRIKIAKDSVPKESYAAAAAEEQAVAVGKADRQRILAETALLRAEVRRAEAGTIQAIGSLRTAQDDLKALQGSVTRRMEAIKVQLNATKFRRLGLAEIIGNTSGAREEDVQRRRGYELQLRTLRERLSPISYGALKAENEAYQAELHQASSLVQESESAEAKAASQAQQLKAQVGAQDAAAKAAAETSQAAQEEGQHRLEAAVARTAADLEHAQEQKAKMEQVLAEKCQAEWQERSAVHQVKLDACRQIQQELMTTRAQQDVLKQTLKAQTTAANTD